MNKPITDTSKSELANSPNYIGMGTLAIPRGIYDAMEERDELRRQARNSYGYNRENIMIEADNILVKAIDKYASELAQPTEEDS